MTLSARDNFNRYQLKIQASLLRGVFCWKSWADGIRSKDILGPRMISRHYPPISQPALIFAELAMARKAERSTDEMLDIFISYQWIKFEFPYYKSKDI